MKRNFVKYLLVSLLLLFSVTNIGCKKDPISIENATITLSQEIFSYTGSEITPAITVVLDDVTLVCGSDYTITYSNNINVGNATILVTGINEYTSSLTKPFTITPATITGISANEVNVTYDGTPHFIVVNGLTSNDTVSYKLTQSGEYSSQNPTFTNVGNYTVYYKVSRENYSSFESSSTITILPAKITNISASGVTAQYDGSQKFITVNGLSTGDQVTYSLSENGEFTSTNPGISNAGETKVYYKVSRENYSDFISYATINISPIVQTNITFENQNLYYDGTQKIAKIYAPENSKIYYKTTYSGTYSPIHPVVKEVGRYTIYFKVVTPNYIDYENCVLITITTASQSGISADNIWVDYTGEYHSIEVKNVSAGSTVLYKTNQNSDYTLTESPKFSDAGIYTVYYKVVNEGFADFESFATITINKLDFSDIIVDDIVEPYDGSQKSLVFQNLPARTTIYYKENEDDNYSTTELAYTDAGEYTIYFLLTNPNYNEFESSATITITKLNQTGITAEDVNCTYDERSKFILVEGYIDAIVYYKENLDDEYSIFRPSYKDVGHYTTYYKVVRKNYFDYESSATITINASAQQQVTCNNVTYDYNGSRRSITVSGIEDGTVYYSLEQNGEYSIYPIYFIEAGEHRVYYKVVRKNYIDYLSSATITINKVNQSGINADSIKATYDGMSHLISINGAEGATVYYSINNPDNYSTIKPKLIDAGSYEVYYKVVRKNYFDYTGVAVVTIDPIHQSGIQAENVVVSYDGNAHTITVTGIHQDATIKYKLPEFSSYQDIKPEFTEAGTYTIDYSVSRKNYYDYISSATVTINALKMNITYGNQNVIYDGNAHELKISGYPEYSLILYKDSSGEYSSQTTPTYSEMGRYLIEFKISCDNYIDFTGSAYLVISNAVSNITFEPVATSIIYGQTLEYSFLRGGLADVEGSFAWENPNTIPNVSDSNTTLYKVIFTPTSFMYAQAECYLTVLVEAAEPEVTIDTEKLNLYSDMPFPEEIPFTSNATGTLTITSDKVLEDGKEYSYLFTPDSNNFTTYSGTFTLDVKQAEYSHIEITNFENNNYHIDDTVDKDSLQITLHYSDGFTRILASSDFSLEYQKSDCISAGDEYVSVIFGDLVAKLNIVLSKIESTLEFDYSGKTSYYTDYEITAQDFTITNQNCEGTLSIGLNGKFTLSFGRNVIDYTFTPANTDKYTTLSGQTIIELTYSPLITSVSVDGNTKNITFTNQTFSIFTENTEVALNLQFDEEKFIVSTSKENVLTNKLASGNNTINTSNNIVTLYIFQKDNILDSIQTISLAFTEQTQIQGVTFKQHNNLDREQAQLVINEDKSTYYKIEAYSILEDISPILDEGFTYKLMENESTFNLTSCEFKTYNLTINVYNSDNELVEQKSLVVDYEPISELTSISVEFIKNEKTENSQISFVKPLSQLFTTTYPTNQNESVNFTLEIQSDLSVSLYDMADNLIGIVDNENNLLDIAGYLSEGRNYFNLVITYLNNSVKSPLQIDYALENPSSIITGISVELGEKYYNFNYDGVFNNAFSPIPVLYTLQDIDENIVVNLSNTNYAVTTEVCDDTIKINVYNNKLEQILSTNLTILWLGERNNDTSISYEAFRFSLEQINKTTALENQTITFNAGDSFYFELSNEYATYTHTYTGKEILTNNGLHFIDIGSYILSITVTATDKTTTKTYTFTLNVVKDEEIVNIAFKNGDSLSLTANLLTLGFGDFLLTSSKQSDNKFTLNVEKYVDVNKLSEYATDNVTPITFTTSDKFTIYASGSTTPLTSYENVEFDSTLTNNSCNLIFKVAFEYESFDNTSDIEINCKIIFKQATEIISITASNNNIQTTKKMQTLQNVVLGDFTLGKIEDQDVYQTTFSSSSYTLVNNTVDLSISLAAGMTLVDNLSTFTAIDTSKTVTLKVAEQNGNYCTMLFLIPTDNLQAYLNNNQTELMVVNLLIVFEK